ATSTPLNGPTESTNFTPPRQLPPFPSATLFASPGTANVTVAALGQPSPTPLTFTINAMTLSNLQPSSAVAGGPSFLLTVNGSGFDNATSITWNGATETTNFINS